MRIASLVPAVTNMLLELDQQQKLAAVSNYDTDPRVADLPRVGDLLTIDWEQLAAVRATHIIVQITPEQMPPGAADRARQLGAELVSVRLTRLADIPLTLDQLEAIVRPAEGGRWSDRFEERLQEAVRGADGRPALPTLVAMNPSLEFVAGRENYLDDLLSVAGAQNVISSAASPYPRLDREALLALRPRHVVLILPDATEAQLAQARRTLAELHPAWGLKWDDVTVLSDPYAIVPGWSVIEVAERIAAARAEAPRVDTD